MEPGALSLAQPCTRRDGMGLVKLFVEEDIFDVILCHARVRNLLAKFCEFCVYQVIASHPRKPKIRNISPKFSKLAKGGPELSHAIGVGEMHHRCGVAANYVVSAVVMC